jgi:hypothetical protein
MRATNDILEETRMELQHTATVERRTPDWLVGAVAGLAGGAAVMLLDLLWSVIVHDASPWRMSYMIAAILMGRDILQAPGYGFDLVIVAVSLVAHYGLGIVFGLILAALMTPLHLDASLPRALAAGAVFGLLLHFVNFYGMVAFFPWFEELRGVATLIADIVFGVVAAFIYWRFARTPHDA